MHGPLVWTSVGIARQARTVTEAELKFKTFVSQTTDSSNGKIAVDETENADQGTVKTEKNILKGLWDDARVLSGRLRTAPSNTSIARACTNRVIKIKYIDPEVIEQRGETEVFLLGGLGESDTHAILRTYSVNSPLGAAVKGREVGEICTVHLEGGREYDFEIVEISILDKKSEALASTVADRPETIVTRLSIDATGQRVSAAA